MYCISSIQIAVTGVLSVSFSTDQSSRFPWLSGVSDETISQLLVLAKQAYDGTKQDQLIFHELGDGVSLKTLGRVLSGCGFSLYTIHECDTCMCVFPYQ